jgi:hypothetical protein
MRTHLIHRETERPPSGRALAVLIVARARDIYLLHIEETFDVTLSDYETPIRTIAGGLAMIGLVQALRLLLEINRRP